MPRGGVGVNPCYAGRLLKNQDGMEFKFPHFSSHLSPEIWDDSDLSQVDIVWSLDTAAI